MQLCASPGFSAAAFQHELTATTDDDPSIVLIMFIIIVEVFPPSKQARFGQEEEVVIRIYGSICPAIKQS